jgi:hypothetical protein
MLAKISWAVAGIVVVTAIAAYALLPHLNIQLWSPEPRPTNVPTDAIPIPYIAKSRLWAKCWTENTQTRCRIFNGAGKLLHDDVFVSYAQGTSVAASDLEIVPERSGADYLWLKNGDILLPETNYSGHRQSMEQIIQKMQN